MAMLPTKATATIARVHTTPWALSVRRCCSRDKWSWLTWKRLAAPELVAEAPAACEKVYAGKGPTSDIPWPRSMSSTGSMTSISS